MEDIEKVLPKLLKIQLFSDFNIDDKNDIRILSMVYENLSIKKYKKGDVIIKEGAQKVLPNMPVNVVK